MRYWLVAMLFLPMAQGLTFADAAGDVEQRVMGEVFDLRNTDLVDIVEATVVETQTDFEFSITFAGESQDGDAQMSAAMEFSFDHGDQRYRTGLTLFSWPTDTKAHVRPWAHVMRAFDTSWEYVRQAPVTAFGNEYQWTVPREVFIDHTGAAPEIGSSFENLRVGAYGGMGGIGIGVAGTPPTWSFIDWAPDAGNESLPFQYGLTQRGASLSSHEPFRASNGEAGVFYFNASLQADEAATFQLKIAEIPRGWTIRLPFESIDVDEEASFLVEVKVPFAHQHGSREQFRLIAETDVALAQIHMGIHYVETPQPSGHHERVWLHSAGGDGDVGLTRSEGRGWPFLNTLEDYLGNVGNPIQATDGGMVTWRDGGAELNAEFDARLSPSLRMGLNVTDEIKEFEIEVDTAHPLMGAHISGDLQWFQRGTWHSVATLSSDPQDLMPGITRIRGTITGSPQIVEYEKGIQMGIRFFLHGTSPDVHENHISPYVLPGGWFDLPLAEYTDSIADATGSLVAEPSDEAVESFAEGDSEPSSKKSPGLPLAFVLAALLLARRR